MAELNEIIARVRSEIEAHPYAPVYVAADEEDCPGTYTLSDGDVIHCEASKGHPKYHVCEMTYRWTDDTVQPDALAAAEARGERRMIDALRDEATARSMADELGEYHWYVDADDACSCGKWRDGDRDSSGRVILHGDHTARVGLLFLADSITKEGRQDGE